MKTRFIYPIIFFLSSCASITTGTMQSVMVTTKPAGADCTLSNDKGSWQIDDTPGSASVHRAYSELSVVCEKGKLSGTVSVPSATKGSAFGNIIFGGVIGGAVDMGNGAAYDYPAAISVRLK